MGSPEFLPSDYHVGTVFCCAEAKGFVFTKSVFHYLATCLTISGRSSLLRCEDQAGLSGPQTHPEIESLCFELYLLQTET